MARHGETLPGADLSGAVVRRGGQPTFKRLGKTRDRVLPVGVKREYRMPWQRQRAFRDPPQLLDTLSLPGDLAALPG